MRWLVVATLCVPVLSFAQWEDVSPQNGWEKIVAETFVVVCGSLEIEVDTGTLEFNWIDNVTGYNQPVPSPIIWPALFDPIRYEPKTFNYSHQVLLQQGQQLTLSVEYDLSQSYVKDNLRSDIAGYDVLGPMALLYVSGHLYPKSAV